MSNPFTARATSDLPRFDVVDAVTPVGNAPCADCRGPIVDTYYERNQHVICAACQARFVAASRVGATTGGFTRATGFGIGATIVGAATYFAVLAVTGYEVAVVAIVVGFLVGAAVRHGARGLGGRRYQWLAAGLTYVAIAITYVPFVMKGFDAPTMTAVDSAATVVEIGALLLLAASAPVLGGVNHLIGIAIVFIALAVAWRMNRHVELAMSGPYRVR